MRDDLQLDLFDWRPPCEVVPFPHGRMIGRARDLLALRTKTSENGMRFIWKGEVQTLDRAMAAAGIPVRDRDRQLEAFADLVRSRIAFDQSDWSQSGGDAA